jgi:RNA polymerase sigma-70 factor (ECF subfamily)
VPLSQASAVERAAAELRSETASYLRAESKSKFAEIRKVLTPEDAALLTLRVDKQLPWNDVARVLLEESGNSGDDDVKRESARLRKRFEILKKKLLELGRQHGLVSSKDA